LATLVDLVSVRLETAAFLDMLYNEH
jgi:hypothetical protein